MRRVRSPPERQLERINFGGEFIDSLLVVLAEGFEERSLGFVQLLFEIFGWL